MRFMTKTRQDNDRIDRAGLLYAENKTELSWLIQSSTIYDEDQIGLWSG